MTSHLVDLASHQHGIRLAKVKAAGFTRVNVKISEGTDTTVNPDAGMWIGQAKGLGMDLCTFHWLNGSHSGKQQAAVALGQLRHFGLMNGTAHQVDCEDTKHPATWTIWRDYVNAMQDALGRHVINYTGDWWWPGHMGKNNGAALTPYLWAAPNHGYDSKYPGDASAEWHAGYGGWGGYSALQYAVSPVAGAGGGKLSKTAFRDPKVWSALTGLEPTGGFLMALSDDQQKNVLRILENLDSVINVALLRGETVLSQRLTMGDGSAIDGAQFVTLEDMAAIKGALGGIAEPIPVDVDATAVAMALANNPDFLKALAKAVNDDAAERLTS
jgi:hypothetical protein